MKVNNMTRQWNKIAHISDIHIRTVARQDEYKKVFGKLIDSLREQEVDAVVITGDTVHSKTQMSPELIQTLYFLFDGLNSLGIKIIIIPGNHDASLSNLSRTDAITPILNISDFKNIDYLRDTGVYNYGDVDFYHYSVFQNREVYDTTIQNPEHINIALYHGPINGSQNESQFTFESQMSVGFFKPFDCTMLGDIHMRQCLRENKPIWYAGSLIQQNYGEELEKGYLIWNIRGVPDVDFVELKNDYAFHTLYANKGLVEDATIDAKNPRIRLYFDKLSVARLDEIKAELIEKYNALEIIPHEVENKLDTDIKDEFEDSNFYDINVQNKLIREYLLSRYPALTAVEVEKILDINSDIEHIVLEDPTYADKKSLSKWTLKKLSFDNFFTFGANNEIDFDDLHGITGILGANAQGKSSILETITFAIFGTTSKNLSLAQVVNNKKDRAKVYITLESDGQLFEIERVLKVHERNGSRSATQKLTFNRIDQSQGALLEELNGDDKNATEKNIRERFGTPDDFLNTAMVAQNNWASFIKSKDTNRKNILMSFLDLTAFEKKSKVATKINRDNITVLQELNKEDLSSQLAGVNDDIVTYKGKIAVAVDKSEKASKKRNELQKEKEQLSQTIRQVDIQEIDVEAKENEIEVHKATILSLKDKSVEILSQSGTNDKRLEELREQQTKHDKRVIELSEANKSDHANADKLRKGFTAEWEELKAKLDHRKKEIDDEGARLSKLESDLKSKILLKKHEIKTNDENQSLIKGAFVEHDVCTECVLVKFAFEARDKSEQLQIDLENLEKELKIVEDLIDAQVEISAQLSDEYKAEYNEYENELITITQNLAISNEELQNEIDALKVVSQEIEKLTSENKVIEAQIQAKVSDAERLGTTIQAIKLEVKLYQENQKTIEQNKEIMTKISDVQTQFDQAESEYQKYRDDEVEFKSVLAATEERKANIIDKLDKVKEKREIIDKYSYYLAAIHRNGIPSDIISNTLHKINFEISRLLDSVVEFKLNIVDDNDKIGIFLQYINGEQIPIEASSGMESIMSELAIRKAFLKVSMKPKPTFVAIDEGFSALDSETQASLHSMFTVLRSAFTHTFIISHIEQLKDYMDNNIDLRKQNNETHIGTISTL